MNKLDKKVVKLKDLISEIKGSKYVKIKNVKRVVEALPKVISKMLLSKVEVRFSPFVKLGFRIAKDRIVNNSLTGESLHIPQHLRFKGYFYDEFKTFLNTKVKK